MIKVEYRLDSPHMSDEEWENQEERVFVITKDMIIDLIQDKVVLPEGTYVDTDNVFTTKM
jgi:hypothetical protein